MEINPDTLTDHDKEMIAVAEKGDPNDPGTVTTPEEKQEAPALPEGVESLEDLIAQFNELSTAKEGDSEGDSEESKEGEESAEADDQKDAEENEEPTLSDAEIELREYKAYEEVGGKDNYNAMTEFAKANLSDEQIAIYDSAVNGLDQNVATLAVQGLNAMFKLNQMETFGQEGELTNPSTGGLGVTQGFATQSDMMAAMADKRYQTDETYVNQVMQKMALSNF